MVKEEGEFDGFITRDGELISIEDTDRVSAIFLRTSDVDSAVETLWHLVAECYGAGYFSAACRYIEKIIPLVETPGQKAECFLRMGGAMEEMKDYPAALAAYVRAFELPPERNDTWYFLNNNRGYCLNQAGRSEEAELYCRAAIKLEPERHNAHKNLGISLAQQGRYAEAAECCIRATRLCPSDARALSFLDDLFKGHKELIEEVPDFLAQLHECHELVQGSEGEPLLQ